MNGCRKSIVAWLLLLQVASVWAECPDKIDFGELASVGWGIDHRNTRHQPRSTLTADNVDRLEVKWVYALSNETPRSFPLVTANTIFIGDTDHGVVALDRETGCERWHYQHSGYISSAIVPGQISGRPIIAFMDRFKGVYVLDASEGKLLWHAEVTEEPVPMYSGTPLITATSIFVPVASMEVTLAINPFYGCCTSSGGMAAFELSSGKPLWYLPTIEEEAQKTHSHFFFVDNFGPSGAPVWGAPAYDETRNALFFGTGQNYTHPTTETSDAIFSLDASTGEVNWLTQFTENDAYTAACNISEKHPNCAKPMGPDVDFGAPVMLVTTKSGQELVIAGQKSAEVHAMDRDTGKPVWTTRLGRGGIIGGVHHGLAANETKNLVFVPISDKAVMGFPSPGEPSPGLYALDMQTGERKWSYSRPSRCETEECAYGISSAVTTTNDIVVAGAMDGMLEIFHAETGERLWQHNSWRDYPSVNKSGASGGAFDAHGPMIADDLLMVTSGYQYVGAQRGGNAFIVFQLVNDDD